MPHSSDLQADDKALPQHFTLPHHLWLHPALHAGLVLDSACQSSVAAITVEQVVNHISKCLFVIPLKDYVGQWPNATLEESHDYTVCIYFTASNCTSFGDDTDSCTLSLWKWDWTVVSNASKVLSAQSHYHIMRFPLLTGVLCGPILCFMCVALKRRVHSFATSSFEQTCSWNWSLKRKNCFGSDTFTSSVLLTADTCLFVQQFCYCGISTFEFVFLKCSF